MDKEWYECQNCQGLFEFSRMRIIRYKKWDSTEQAWYDFSHMVCDTCYGGLRLNETLR